MLSIKIDYKAINIKEALAFEYMTDQKRKLSSLKNIYNYKSYDKDVISN